MNHQNTIDLAVLRACAAFNDFETSRTPLEQLAEVGFSYGRAPEYKGGSARQALIQAANRGLVRYGVSIETARPTGTGFDKLRALEACDLLNEWAREIGVPECEDPFHGRALRELVDRIWTRVGGGRSVWLLTSGDGSEGDEWNVHSVHATEQGALKAKEKYEEPRRRPDGSTYHYDANVEEWPVGR